MMGVKRGEMLGEAIVRWQLKEQVLRETGAGRRAPIALPRPEGETPARADATAAARAGPPEDPRRGPKGGPRASIAPSGLHTTAFTESLTPFEGRIKQNR